MSKQTGVVFASAVRSSTPSGGVEKHRCAEDVQDLLGAAMSIWFEGSIDLVQNGAGGTIKITFKGYHTCIPDALAGDVGPAIALTGTVVYTAAGKVAFQLNGPFMSKVEIVAEIETTGAATQSSASFVLYACTNSV